MTYIPIAIFCVVLGPGAFSGQAPGTPLSFEVASVKPVGEPPAAKDEYTAGYIAGMREGLAEQGILVRGQNVTLTDQSLRDLIRLAYQAKDHQLSASAWMAEAKFDIAARMPVGAGRAQAPEMLRTLLEERFHLKVHREKRTMAVYALLPARGGPKLTPTVYKNGARNGRPGRVRGFAISLDGFADLLEKAENRPVADLTGIAGLYDFDLTYTTESAAESEEPGASLATALREKFGLRLERRKMPVEILVVDQADRAPTPN